MIQAVKPAAQGADNRFHRWEKESEERFSRMMAKARSRLPGSPNDNKARGEPYRFDNPAFNILTGTTNYVLSAIASDRRMNNAQLELFERRAQIAKSLTSQA